MTTFLENPNDFNVYHDKFIYYSDGTFTSLRAGCTGMPNPNLCNKTPNALSTTIYCKQNDKELFYSLKKSIEKLQSNDIRVHTSEPNPIKKIISTKPEYEQQINEINKQNEEIDKKFDSLCDQLFELGCDRIEGGPIHIEIPMEYYNTTDEYYYNGVPFTIYCPDNTELYKLLNK